MRAAKYGSLKDFFFAKQTVFRVPEKTACLHRAVLV
jgi:hypothetical protein